MKSVRCGRWKTGGAFFNVGPTACARLPRKPKSQVAQARYGGTKSNYRTKPCQFSACLVVCISDRTLRTRTTSNPLPPHPLFQYHPRERTIHTTVSPLPKPKPESPSRLEPVQPSDPLPLHESVVLMRSVRRGRLNSESVLVREVEKTDEAEARRDFCHLFRWYAQSRPWITGTRASF